MNVTSRRPGWYLAALLLGGVVFALAGCTKSGENLAPVAGKVTVDGKPLKSGTVSFRPDKAKGNNSAHQPNGTVDAEGNYSYMANKGAPENVRPRPKGAEP